MGDDRCELYQVTSVVGEQTIQVVKTGRDPIPPCVQPVRCVLDATVSLKRIETKAFTDKVVVEGIFEVQLLYAGCDTVVRCTSFEVPFDAYADIKGTRPEMQVELAGIKIEEATEVDSHVPDDHSSYQTFEVTIVAHLLIKVVEAVQRRLAVCYVKEKPVPHCHTRAPFARSVD